VILDVRQLKELRLQRALSQESVADRSVDRRLCLSLASIKRAEAGKPVLYRTARHLAEFYGVVIAALLHPAAPAETGTGLERRQFQSVLDTVAASGRGRLIEVRGAARSGKSQLLRACAQDAEQHGFTCATLRAGEGVAQLGALARLIAQPARSQLLLVTIDDLHHADEPLTAMLEEIVPPSLAMPVIWMLARGATPPSPRRGRGDCLEQMPRTVFHLAAPPQTHGFLNSAQAPGSTAHACF
jgi:transcriptional regulator with XRE-family HTH domain